LPAEDLVEFAVDHARARGASYAEARYEQQDQEQFILKNGVLDALFVGEDRGIGVRVLLKGALGFAATNLLTKAEVRATVDAALKCARTSKRKSPIEFAREDAVLANWSVPEGERLADVAVEEKIQEIARIDASVTAQGLKIPARYFVLGTNRIRKDFANSEGSRIRSSSPRMRLLRIGSMKSAMLGFVRSSAVKSQRVITRHSVSSAATTLVARARRPSERDLGRTSTATSSPRSRSAASRRPPV